MNLFVLGYQISLPLAKANGCGNELIDLTYAGYHCRWLKPTMLYYKRNKSGFQIIAVGFSQRVTK
jgi:hypothetical protein